MGGESAAAGSVQRRTDALLQEGKGVDVRDGWGRRRAATEAYVMHARRSSYGGQLRRAPRGAGEQTRAIQLGWRIGPPRINGKGYLACAVVLAGDGEESHESGETPDD